VSHEGAVRARYGIGSADMGDKDRFADPFGLAKPRAPADRELTRLERLELFEAACSALAKGEMPPAVSAKFLGTAGLAWLQDGGSLERDHLKLSAPRGSHYTAAELWRHCQKAIIADDENQI